MRKLARKWRESTGDGDGSSIPVRDDDLPMDTRDQEEVVQSMEMIQAQQSLFWKKVIAGVILCYVALLGFSIFWQAYAPWDLWYHAYFMYVIPSWSLIGADLAAGVVCLVAIAGLLHSSKQSRLWIWYSLVHATILAIFWLYHMLRLAKFRWEIIWLPLTPFVAAAFCLYVDRIEDDASEELRKLRGYMYAYKAY